MNRKDIEEICTQKANDLLNKYFGNLAKEAAIERPETIGDYDIELPLRIETEYREILRDIWNGLVSDDSRKFEELFDKPQDREIMTADDREGISEAYKKAQQRTLWERITNTNHEDVTFYKGLLEEYTRELLFCMKIDFIEEIN